MLERGERVLPPALILCLMLQACGAPTQRPDSHTQDERRAPAVSAAPVTPCPSELANPDLGPISKEVDAALPQHTSRQAVLAWFDRKGCTYKFGRTSNPLMPICQSARPCEYAILFTINFDAQDTSSTIGMFPNWY